MDFIEIKQDNFKEKVVKSEKPAVVVFYTYWSGSSQILFFLLEQIVSEISGGIDIFKMDVDSNPNIRDKYHINNIPIVLIFRDGTVFKTLPGIASKAILKKEIEDLVK